MDSDLPYYDSQFTIFYDGWCKLCSGSVNLLRKTKSGRQFHYLPIQYIDSYIPNISDISQQVVGEEIVVVRNGQISSGAKGVLVVLHQMGGVYGVLYHLLKLMPNRMLDWLYKYIANNRYRWFGKKDSCDLV